MGQVLSKLLPPGGLTRPTSESIPGHPCAFRPRTDALPYFLRWQCQHDPFRCYLTAVYYEVRREVVKPSRGPHY